jgi:glutamyl-tRNA reductase
MQNVKPACKDNILDKFYYNEGKKAIEHLFSVSSGLDSLVIGENEILGQVKAAYKMACDHKTSGMMTNKLFHAAFKTSKRVKNETAINEGNCSIGYVAVDIAEDMFSDIQHCKVLLIGAGQIGRVVAKNFAKRGVEDLIIANRDFTKAESLVEEVGGSAIPLEKISEYIGRVDVAVSGTGSPDYLLCYEEMQSLLPHSSSKPLLMIDIALPRDFDPDIGSLPHVILKNLYDLSEVVDRNIKKREQEVPKVQKIIQEEVQKFLHWKDSLKINSTIKSLTQYFEAIRQKELEKYQHQFSEETSSQIEAFTKSLTKKYIHLIVSNIKSLHEVCELEPRQIHILEHLFDSQEISDKRTRCRVKRE